MTLPTRTGGTPRTIRALLLAGASALAPLAGCGPGAEGLRTVLDLAAALPVAETYREVDVIELGTPLAAENLLWGWSWNEREAAGEDGQGEETTFTWGLGDSSGLRFYLTTRRDLRLELRGRPGAQAPDGPQVVTVEVNGETVGEVRMQPREAGWVDYPVTVPREVLATGWNNLTLEYRHSVHPRRRGRSGDRRPLAVAWDRIRLDPARPLGGGEPEAPSPDLLRLPLGTEVAYYAPLPPGSTLVIDELRASGVDSRLLVRLRWEGEEPVEVASLDESEHRRVLKLPPPAEGGGDGEPRLARLSLRAAAAAWLQARDAPADGALEVVAPRVLAPPGETTGEEPPASPRPAPAAAPGPVPASAPAARRPDVLVYLIDTLRADRVGAYDRAAAERGLTPAIDAFAEGAVVLEDALTQAPWTRPTVASLFTGLPPLAHGVTTLQDRLPREAVTLAEVLRGVPGGGYRTAAWSTNAHVTRQTGLAQGFQSFQYLPDQPPPERVNARVVAWLDRHLEAARERPERPRRPFFLYVHALDPHAPYRPPPELRQRFAPEVTDPEAGSRESVVRVHGASGEERARLLAPLPHLYDAEVALADRGFGQLLAALEERGLREDMVIVLLADHGEAFDEHGHLGHGNDLYQETLAIPLIVDLPERDAGRRAGTALPMDVPATVLAALGVPKPPEMDGTDLLGSGGNPAGRPAFSHLDYGGREGLSVVLGDWKLIEPLNLGFGRAPELYHLGRDPGERENVAGSHPVRTGYLRSLVRRHLLETRGRDGGGDALVLDPELRKDLEALGYL